MPRTADAVRALLRRWIARRDVLAFLPALLLALYWAAGPVVLIAAAILFPLVVAVLGAQRSIMRRNLARDGLTGLATRGTLVAALDEVFEEGPRGGRTTAVFALGIDDYAEIAVRHGTNAAEEVQRRTGERLAAAVRRGDTVARLGEGLFAVAFGPVLRADLETAIQAAARFQAAVREAVPVEGARVHLTCSVGFCLAARAPRPAGEDALAAAIEALEEAQGTGPGAIRAWSGTRPAEAARREALASEAVAALERGQIRPWFQPQISTDTGLISGFEALARWEHPERGVLAPRHFLPALTEAGQIERLGEVMLFHSLTALRAWDRAGLKVPSVGVNFSADELRNPRLAEKLAWELDRFELTPDRITVEILETVMADAGDDSVTRTIGALSRMGCRIDLDDFGTGHASIAALRRFRVGRIKIDRSFVINVDEDRDQQLMVAAILGLAERLGLETLAEGVERVGEHAILAQLGCGHVQGYGIARPMPVEDTVGWAERHAAKLAAAPEVSRRTG